MILVLDSSSREGKDFSLARREIGCQSQRISWRRSPRRSLWGEPLRVEDLKGFKVAWAGFMRMGESQAIYSQKYRENADFRAAWLQKTSTHSHHHHHLRSISHQANHPQLRPLVLPPTQAQIGILYHLGIAIYHHPNTILSEFLDLRWTVSIPSFY